MHILVVDVAAEYGGAKTILDQFISDFEKDTSNDYLILLSKLHYSDTENVHYISFPWVKKNHLYRMIFDNIIVKTLVKQSGSDLVISLQNNAVNTGHVEQHVYFQNALPFAEKRFTFKESKYLWFYQKVISKMIRKSLRRAKRIYVQAEWIKKSMIKFWHINENSIIVKKPKVIDTANEVQIVKKEQGICKLFYPAGYSPYKNHFRLITACKSIWNKYGVDCGLELVLTGEKDNLPEQLNRLIENENYPILFVGRLDRTQMNEMYSSSILVFPSYIETVGLPIMEAQLFRAKILCSDLEYSRESIGEYDNVAFFDPYSVDSIAESILTCMRECNCFGE
jgi:glycosyltransferase involved in cell wall biosynthesis